MAGVFLVRKPENFLANVFVVRSHARSGLSEGRDLLQADARGKIIIYSDFRMIDWDKMVPVDKLRVLEKVAASLHNAGMNTRLLQ